MKKTVLILGRGFVGKGLEDFLNGRGVPVEAYSRAALDYTSPHIFQKFLMDNPDKYETVINCSGYTGIPNVDGCEANKQDCWYWNVIVPRNIVLSANGVGIPVAQINSGCIYTGNDKEFTEDDEPNFGLYSNDSSFYSKCKHACETILTNCYAHSLRIRMPFDGTTNRKNYLNKIYKYNDLISFNNSLTSMEDFNNFMLKFIFFQKTIPPGPLNVVNTGHADAKTVVEIMKKYNIVNPKWNFVENVSTVARRSNCVLSVDRIRSFGMELPPVYESLERDISKLAASI